MLSQHILKSGADSRQEGGFALPSTFERFARFSLISAFGLSFLATACGEESKPGTALPTVTAPQGSTAALTSTGGSEQGPGVGATGTSTPGTTGAVPGTQPGVTTSTSVGTTSTTSSSDTTSTSSSEESSSSDPAETSSDGETTTEPEPEPEPKVRKRYTEGHGDLYVGYDEEKDEAKAYFQLGGSTAAILDGKEVSGEFSVDEVMLVGAGQITRDLDDVDDLLKGMCVEKGQSLYWLPKEGTDCARFKVPFFGWGSGLRPLDTAKKVTIKVTGFEAPSPNGHFSVWKRAQNSPFPQFPVSTCDGLEGDQFEVETGHDHLSLGFTGDPGLWLVHFRGEFSLNTTNKDYHVDFTIHFLIQ